MDSADRLLAAADLIQPGDLVVYHGSIPSHHGLWIAHPCPCRICTRHDQLGLVDPRYDLTDPWGERPGPYHVRRQSITRSTANA